MLNKRSYLGITLAATIWICGCAIPPEEASPFPETTPIFFSPSLMLTSTPMPTSLVTDYDAEPTLYVHKWATLPPSTWDTPPQSLQWVMENDAAIFTDEDMGFEDIVLNMARDDVLAILGPPFETEDEIDDARSYDFRIDRYETGDFYVYVLRDGVYPLNRAIQLSGMWTGPRSLSIGDSIEDVISAFSCQFEDMVIDHEDLRYVILYGLYPDNHSPYGRPCPPCGYITESDDYWLGWERHWDERIVQICYEFHPEDDLMYQQVLAGELENIALGEFFCTFTIQNEHIIAIEWGKDLGSA